MAYPVITGEPSAALRRFCWLRNAGNGSDVRAFYALPCSLTAKLAQRSGKNRSNRGLLLSGALFAGALMAAIVTMAGLAHGQSAPESAPVASEEAPAAAIPLADLVTESESLSEVMRDIRADLSADRIIEEVAQRLPAITREIDGRLRENRKIVSGDHRDPKRAALEFEMAIPSERHEDVRNDKQKDRRPTHS